MNDFFTSGSFSDYVQSDNEDSRKIYTYLVKSYQKSLVSFPKEVNLQGVYFFEILKFLTLLKLKEREILYNYTPKDKYSMRALGSWPYIGYQDILSGCDITSKSYGKNISVQHRKLKQFAQSLVNLQFLFGKKIKYEASISTPIIENKSNIWKTSFGLKTNLIDFKQNWFYIPQLEDQLTCLRKTIYSVMEENFITFPRKTAFNLLKEHIKANCIEGTTNINFNCDFLLLKSGLEFNNRVIGMIAKQKKIPVINIMHGEGFGTLDEPIFSNLGEGMYSDLILGYGNAITNVKSAYKYPILDKVNYIPSSGAETARNFSENFFGINKAGKKINYYYFPNTLSGASHRYGPYKDTADQLYLAWQRKLFSLFGDKIKIKAHPKEKSSIPNSQQDTITADLQEVISDIDVFVFDHIGTAFNIACSTNKPVIYFHLGIRNIHIEALHEIKKRTIFIDIRDDNLNLQDIEQLLNFDSRINTYSINYSLGDGDNNRASSLIKGIQQFIK